MLRNIQYIFIKHNKVLQMYNVMEKGSKLIDQLTNTLTPLSSPSSRKLVHRVAGIALPVLCLNPVIDSCVTIWECAGGAQGAFQSAKRAFDKKEYVDAFLNSIRSLLGALSAAVLCTNRSDKWQGFVMMRLAINALKLSPSKTTTSDLWGSAKLGATSWKLSRSCKTSVGFSTGLNVTDRGLKSLRRLKQGFIPEAVSYAVVAVVKGLRGYRSVQASTCTI